MDDASATKLGGAGQGIRTFLIADVRGYTLFTQERGDEAAAKLAARFAEICREEISEHGGSVIELRGDEALAVFESPRQAIRASTLLQRRFVEETEADPTIPLPVGIGLDAGEAVALEGGYRGGALNLAARLCGRARPGEILASQGVIHMARKVDGVRLVERGKLQLKGLGEPVRVFAVISEEEDAAERMKRLLPAPPSKGRAPIRLAKRHPIVAAAIALAVVALVAIPATRALRGGGSSPALAGDALAMLDLGSGDLKGSTVLESRPGDIAVGAGGVWVTLPDRGEVIRIDPETMTISDTIHVGADPSGITIGKGSVWVSNGGSSTVSRISPETDDVVQTIELPGGPAGIAFGAGGVWVANSFNASVSHIDPESGEIMATIGVGDRPVDVAVDDHGVWVSNATSDTVSRVDPVHELEVQTVPVGSRPDAIVAGPEGVWVSNLVDGTVSNIDPETNGVVQTIPVGDRITGVTLGEGSLWVSDGSGSVTTIDTRSGSRISSQVGSGAEDVVAGGGALWVTLREAPAAHRGGTLTVRVPSGSIDAVDPAVAYIPESLGVLSLTNDGLIRFQYTGGIEGTRLVPDLARSLPKPTDGGKTYTFQLRPGIRYSTGKPVLPQDFRRAIERVFANLYPYDKSPSGGVQYFSHIVGADSCTPGKPCDLSRGIVADEGASTVTFHLDDPDPDFLYKLAMTFAVAVPEGTPDALLGKDESLPATGPYMIRRVTKKMVVLDRNPEFRVWSEAARPDGFPDHIVWRIGSDPDDMVDDVLTGHADLVFEQPPADRIDELKSSHAGQMHFFPAAQTAYMNLNTEAPPFNDMRVRQALNFAVDRQAIAEIYGGGARPTCQILPPNFSGYDPYCPYTRHPSGRWTAPDLERAGELVRRSGTVTVLGTRDFFPQSVPVGRYFADLLNDLGYHSTFKVVPGNAYISALYDPSRRPDMAFLAWQTDYLAESGFILPTLSCKGNGNASGFCDPALDRRMKAAARVQLTDAAAARQRWSSIEHEIVDRAVWLPLVNAYWVNLVSQRVGNFQVNPQMGPLVDQMWVR
ncbi:MAG: hypothetical protein QOH90_102 [Actinomycetota bacterium]|nr:hypothetical protein [Actinomycetota bacterium]